MGLCTKTVIYEGKIENKITKINKNQPKLKVRGNIYIKKKVLLSIKEKKTTNLKSYKNVNKRNKNWPRLRVKKKRVIAKTNK